MGRRLLYPSRISHPFRPFGLWLALALAGGQATAAVIPVDPPERLSEHRHAGDGRLHFLRNDAVQPTAAQVAARSQPARPATLSVFERAELNSPAWTNDVATARQLLAQHAAGHITDGQQLATPEPRLPSPHPARVRERSPTPVVDLSWPEAASTPELWTTTNLADGPWALWPDPLTTNFRSLTNATGQQIFRLKAAGW